MKKHSTNNGNMIIDYGKEIKEGSGGFCKMITVKIENETALDMLVDRVKFWTNDAEIIDLYKKMYENYVYCGVFDNGKFDVMCIVDNDYINYTRIISQGDEEFDELFAVYKEQGIGDCSCETDICDYIESTDNENEPTLFLVR